MKLDVNLTDDLATIGDIAVAAEKDGYAGGWVGETRHDVLLELALAAVPTERIELGTSIVVAFARSPMITAIAANDVQRLSQGRLLLGLGSQVRAHITNRFSMPWSAPAARMREYIMALQAIWANWNEGVPLKFRGEYYTHTLMTPFFTPEPNPYGAPKVYLAAVGDKMTEVAGEVSDGLLCHGFTTERYVREVTLPALARGIDQAGRKKSDVAVSISPFIATGLTEEEFEESKSVARGRIAFYGSTPSYRRVFELHGWNDLQSDLWRMAKDGRWTEMGGIIDDDVLEAFTIVGEPDQIAPMFLERYGDIADRVHLAASGDSAAALAPARSAILSL